MICTNLREGGPDGRADEADRGMDDLVLMRRQHRAQREPQAQLLFEKPGGLSSEMQSSIEPGDSTQAWHRSPRHTPQTDMLESRARYSIGCKPICESRVELKHSGRPKHKGSIVREEVHLGEAETCKEII